VPRPATGKTAVLIFMLRIPACADDRPMLHDTG
jgi:hypothetical protein